MLIDYTNSKGQKLQGTLTLPAGYEPGKKYPMLVVLLRDHVEHAPLVLDADVRNSPQMSTYASNGYLVFQPDVVYEIGKPGTSAVDCVTSGVKKVIELGYADPKHIGLQGHSWGGYQSSYIVTQTDMFAAVVTGAPPTNLISFYDELYKQTRHGAAGNHGTRPGAHGRERDAVDCRRSLRTAVADLQRHEDQDAVHDPAGHGGRRGRLGSRARVLQRRAAQRARR